MNRKPLIQRIGDVLLRRRDALRRSLSGELEHVSPPEERGVSDAGDAALDADYREISSGLVEAESRELVRIERALERLREGRYGACEGCGKKIPVSRLQALPYATTCVQCQKLREQGRAAEAPAHDWSRLPEMPGAADDLTLDSVDYITFA